jgi:hypothetical protein
MNTDLEEKEIQDLCAIIKEKHHEIKIKNIDIIIDDMVYSLHYDKRINNIYGKKTVTIGALKNIFVHHNNDYIKIINDHCDTIDNKIVITNYKMLNKNKKKCCIIC